MPGLKELSALFGKIIDYRSRHTSAHSRSVARLCEALGRLSGFSESDCCRIHVAGNLHDLGKLALPASILDKPGALDAAERKAVKSHPYHTYRVLKDIAGLGGDRGVGFLPSRMQRRQRLPFPACRQRHPFRI